MVTIAVFFGAESSSFVVEKQLTSADFASVC